MQYFMALFTSCLYIIKYTKQPQLELISGKRGSQNFNHCISHCFLIGWCFKKTVVKKFSKRPLEVFIPVSVLKVQILS